MKFILVLEVDLESGQLYDSQQNLSSHHPWAIKLNY